MTVAQTKARQQSTEYEATGWHSSRLMPWTNDTSSKLSRRNGTCCALRQKNASPVSKIEDTFHAAELKLPAYTQTIASPKARGARVSKTVYANVEKAANAGIPKDV